MKRYRVVFSPEARRDLGGLYDWIVLGASATTALRYMDRLEQTIRNLDTFPRRGIPREDIGRDVRTIFFRRHYAIAFRIVEDAGTVEILQIYYAGRQIVRSDRPPDEDDEGP